MPNKANKFDIRLQMIKHAIVYGIKLTVRVSNTTTKTVGNGYIPCELSLNFFIARRRGIGTPVSTAALRFNAVLSEFLSDFFDMFTDV